MRIGLWLSPWEIHRLTTAQWVAAIKGLSYASSYPNRPVVVFGVCGSASETTSLCQFQHPADLPDYPNIQYAETDSVTPLLNAIEEDGGIDVILDVEPMHAQVSHMIELVMTKFGNYQCVKGFSPDWEWVLGDPQKTEQLPQWKSELDTYKPHMELHLISWMTDSFGDYRHEESSFGYDGQAFANLDQQLGYFTEWANFFSPYKIAWYWAYASDANWVLPLIDTAEKIRGMHDLYADLHPDIMILMATESPFFSIVNILPTSPMY